MPYCTIAQLVGLFGDAEIIALSNLTTPSATAINAVRVDAAIAYADAEINGYLGGRYALPLVSVPLVLVGKAADIVRYQLDSIHPREDVRVRYEDTLRWLKMVADGKVELGLAGNGDEVPSNSYGVAYSATASLFELEGY
jgi:phage gp36-like protein